jgi:translocator protein
MKVDKWAGLIIFLAIVSVIGYLGSIATGISVDNWYAELKKPEWGPPEWVFGPVWTVLYIMIALSGWMVWLKVRGTEDHLPLIVYGIQLFFNALWPWLFFGMQNTVYGFIVIICLFFAILANMTVFWKYNPWASVLLFPYLIWVSFAMSINFVVTLYDLIGG